MAAVAVEGAGRPIRAERPPNVLFISVDDMNNDLGAYGSPVVHSPNLDRLAARGVRFDRAYCQFPLCSPSRSSLMTGLRPDTTRVFDLTYHFRKGLPGVVTLPQFFGKRGYHVARVGKIYHYGNPGQIGTSGLDDPESWMEFHNPAGRDKTLLEPRLVNHTPKRGLGSAMAYLSDEEGQDEDHTDGMVATKAIEIIEREKDRPWFVAVGFYKPHTPYIAPRKYFDLYPTERITVPEIPAGYTNQVPWPALGGTQPWPWFGVTREQARECKRAYYATISFVDAQIGRVLDAVDRLGLRDNTLVVFWSDHGYHLGERGLWMKQSNFEESARVPLVVAAPGLRGAGRGCRRTVELVDLYPTLVDLAGFEVPAGLEGVSLRPLLERPTARWTRPAYTQVQRGRFPGHSIRTERWRYTEWDGGARGVELYDHRADPGELRNLASDPRWARTIAGLREQLHGLHPVPVSAGK